MRDGLQKLTWTTKLHSADGFKPASEEFLADYHNNATPPKYGMDPRDGLPRPAVSTTFEDTKAPALTPKNLVCLGTDTRQTCVYYKRQLVDVAGTEHKLVLRFCTARTDEDGSYMSLRDSAVFACDLRSPPDPESAAELDRVDAKIMAAALAEEEENAPFDLDAALNAHRRTGE